jgi:hypothetical protein
MDEVTTAVMAAPAAIQPVSTAGMNHQGDLLFCRFMASSQLVRAGSGSKLARARHDPPLEQRMRR